MTEPRRCHTCRFWQLVTDKIEPAGRRVMEGDCRRAPPVLIEKGLLVDEPKDRFFRHYLALSSIWPSTQSDDWCGEWGRR